MPTTAACSPLVISHLLYRSTPLDTCALLATRDGVMGLVWAGTGAAAWRVARARAPKSMWTHETKEAQFASSNAEFALFVLLVGLMGGLLWAELLVLAVVNVWVYLSINLTATLCAHLLGKSPPKSHLYPIQPPPIPKENDPISSVRIDPMHRTSASPRHRI